MAQSISPQLASMMALTNALVASAGTLLREANRLFRPFGVTAAHFNVLHLLAEHSEDLRPSQLSEMLVVDASSITYLLDQLEKRRWLERRRDPEDRRAQRVTLTPSGRAIHARVLPVYHDALAALAPAVSRETSEQLTRALAAIRSGAVSAVDQATARQKKGRA